MAIQNLIYLDSTGVHYMDYPTLLEAYKTEYRAIYGADVDLDPDTQDGQWLAVQALAIFETMQIAAAVYSSQSPSTSQSDALTRNVRINGLLRGSATASTVDLLLTGTTGTVITNGAAADSAGVKWLLPSPTTITSGAGTTVTATCSTTGAIEASANTIVNISTPTQGWSTVTNPTAAAGGINVETDYELRNRQRISTSLPSQTIFEGIVGAVKAISPPVGDVRGYENDGTTTDGNGLPAHSIAIVVEGGDSQTIANTIALKKTAGTTTYAAAPSVTMTTVDQYGESNSITFGRCAAGVVKVLVTIDKIAGYESATDNKIKQAVVDYIQSLPIGDDVYLSRLYTPANQSGTAWGNTYIVKSIWATLNGATPTSANTADLVVPFNALPTCIIGNVTLVEV